MRQSFLTLTLVLLCFTTLGSLQAWAECGPSVSHDGANGDCYTTADCGGAEWFHLWCIYIPCYVNGQQAYNGCPILGTVHECNLWGCFNAFMGNCSSC